MSLQRNVRGDIMLYRLLQTVPRGERLTRGALVCALSLATLAPVPAFAGACSAEVATTLAGRKGLHAQTVDGEWRPVRGPLPAEKVRRFAYVGRLTDAAPGREGAAVVRFARLRGPAESEATTVGLRRPDAAPSCGVRALPLLSWTGLDFGAGQKVGVDVYIAHHLADQDVSSVITNFHVDYASLDEGCVSTQKNSKGRRTAFLNVTDGDAERAVPTVARKVIDTLLPSAQANPSSAPAPAATAAEPPNYGERFRREREAFAAFGAVETQIHTYPLAGDRLCVSFAPARALDAEAGTRWSVEVVDLDAPQPRLRRDRYRIDWR